eukprot:505519-Prymnesium_polylepis.1
MREGGRPRAGARAEQGCVSRGRAGAPRAIVRHLLVLVERLHVHLLLVDQLRAQPGAARGAAREVARDRER